MTSFFAVFSFLLLSAASLSAQGPPVTKKAKSISEAKVAKASLEAEKAPCCKLSKADLAKGPEVRNLVDAPAVSKKTEKAFIDVKAVKVKKSTRLKGRKAGE